MIKSYKTSQDKSSVFRSIAIVEGKGVEIFSGRVFTGRGGKQKIMRGEITTFSKAARRRMREFMLFNRISDDLMTAGVSLTIPGPQVTQDQKRKAWDYFKRELLRRGWCCLWRLELQTRGQYHWHCIMGLQPYEYKDIARGLRGKQTLLKEEIRDLWLKIVDTIPVERMYVKFLKVKGGRWCESRSDWVGAKEHAVDVSFKEGKGAWERYLQDHTSKSKNDQIADKGKHWGIINRKLFIPVEIDKELIFENDKSFFKFRRAYTRLMTPTVKKRKGHKTVNRMRHGKSIYFTNTDTVEKLFRWAEDKPGVEVSPKGRGKGKGSK